MSMASEVWEWVVSGMAKLTEDMREYKRRWEMEHKETRKEQNLEAVKRYQKKKMNEDPESYIEKVREVNKKAAKKYYAKRRAEMTPEELEERRRKAREQMRAVRARRKAEKEALEKDQH